MCQRAACVGGMSASRATVSDSVHKCCQRAQVFGDREGRRTVIKGFPQVLEKVCGATA